MSMKFTLPNKNDELKLHKLLDNNPELVRLKVSELSPSKLNPSIRTQEKSLKGLKRSLIKNGQLEPIIVKKQGNKVTKVVNGHRRRQSFISLGWTHIDAIIINNNADYDEIFTAMHQDTLKINTVQECERWLKGASNVSTSTKGRIKTLQERLGVGPARSVITRCVSINKSPGTIASALINYEKYVGNAAKHDLKSNMNVAYWMLNIGSSWKLSTAMSAFIPVELLVKCVSNKKPIPKDWAHNLKGEINNEV